MPEGRPRSDAAAGREPAPRIMAAWLVVAAYGVGIFALSAQSQPFGVSRLPLLADKVLHALLFGGFSLTLFTALRRSRPRMSTALLCCAAAGLSTLYGASDEYHQSFVPHREMDPYDVVADGIGAALAQLGVLVKTRGA